jgi:cytidylate kinase
LGLPVPSGEDLRDTVADRVEASIARVAETGGGVILGRAAAIVLAGRPGAFHVRLDGPPDRRAARATAIEGIDEDVARSRMTETDQARARYVTRLYGRDLDDPRLYHLVVDSTVLPLDFCVELIAGAALQFWQGHAS